MVKSRGGQLGANEEPPAVTEFICKQDMRCSSGEDERQEDRSARDCGNPSVNGLY